MIVAMAVMGMVKPAIGEVVDMIAVRDGLVAAAGSMAVAMAANLWRAAHGVELADLYDVLVDLPVMGVKQMAILKIVDMIPMKDRGVPAVRAVLVGGAGHACLLLQMSGAASERALMLRLRQHRTSRGCSRSSIARGPTPP